VPVQRQIDQEPGAAPPGLGDDAAGRQGPDGDPQRTAGPALAVPAAQQMNGPVPPQAADPLDQSRPDWAAPGQANPGHADPGRGPGAPGHADPGGPGLLLPKGQPAMSQTPDPRAQDARPVHRHPLDPPVNDPQAGAAAVREAQASGWEPRDPVAGREQELHGPVAGREQVRVRPAGFGPPPHPALTADTQMVALGARRAIFGEAQDDPRHDESPAASGLPGAMPSRLPPAVSPVVAAGGTGTVRHVAPDGAPAGPFAGTGPAPPTPIQVSPARVVEPVPSSRPVSSHPVPVRHSAAAPTDAGPTGPARTEPVPTEPVPTEPVRTEPVATGPARSEPAGGAPDPAAPGPAGPDPAGPDLSAPDRPDSSRSGTPRSGTAVGTETQLTDALGVDPARRPGTPMDAPLDSPRAGTFAATAAAPNGSGADIPRQGDSPDPIGTVRPPDAPGWTSGRGTASGRVTMSGRAETLGQVEASERVAATGQRVRDEPAAPAAHATVAAGGASIAPTPAGRRMADPSVADEPMRPGDVQQSLVPLWDDESTRQFHDEWHEIKAQFVDDPVAALTRAHDLLTEAVHELSESLLAERDELDPLRRTSTPDTESMRMAMRGYRDFLDRILTL
jgi:hypothetical protein